MLAESAHSAVLCGKNAIPCRFTAAQWQSAVEAAGGLDLGEPLVRSVRQQCHNQSWTDNYAPYACATELAEVVRVLSGRLV
jgi:hypothetical protein